MSAEPIAETPPEGNPGTEVTTGMFIARAARGETMTFVDLDGRTIAALVPAAVLTELQ